jgi:hypothetical protein
MATGGRMTDEEIIRQATEFRAGLLDGRDSEFMCYMVSAPLAGYLGFCGVQTDLVSGDLGHMNHFWLRLKDGRVLDATADQFNKLFPNLNYPPVYLGPPLDIHPQ